MNRKRILFVLQNLNGGGAEKVFVYLINELVKQGIEVELLLGKREGVYFDLLNEKIKIHTLNVNNVIAYIFKLRIFFKKHKFSHVVTASQNISTGFIIAKKIFGHQHSIIATLHYNLPVQLNLIKSTLSKGYSILINKKVITKADKVVAVSKGVAEGFSQITKFPLEKINVIYNPAYDNAIFDKANEPIEDQYKNKDYIISVGRFEYQKNQKLLLQAFALVKKEKPVLHLLVLGEGTLKSELIELADKLNINDQVHFVGFKTNPYSYLKQAKCFVLSSLYEGLPTVIIEALALGTNVVSTDCPSGPFELLQGGKLGWLSTINDEKKLAANIVAALNTPISKDVLVNASTLYHAKNAVEEYKKVLC